MYNKYENHFHIGVDYMSYNTKQKEIILNIIKGINKPFTVKEIYSKLSKRLDI